MTSGSCRSFLAAALWAISTGAAPAIAALRGGHIEGVVLSLGALSAHIKSGAFRSLVASSRLPEFADIPTMRELGYREELFGT
jgi:tripartite-type tricarboxylate transporter receptor subunit TctC